MPFSTESDSYWAKKRYVEQKSSRGLVPCLAVTIGMRHEEDVDRATNSNIYPLSWDEFEEICDVHINSRKALYPKLKRKVFLGIMEAAGVDVDDGKDSGA